MILSILEEHVKYYGFCEKNYFYSLSSIKFNSFFNYFWEIRKSILIGLQLFLSVVSPFLKTGAISASFRRSEKISTFYTAIETFCESVRVYVVRWAIWYHLYNLKNVKNTHGGLLILVKLQATLLKLRLLYGCFSRFLNYTNGTKSRNASHKWTELTMILTGISFKALALFLGSFLMIFIICLPGIHEK